MLAQFVSGSTATTGAAGGSFTSEHRFHKPIDPSAVNATTAVAGGSSSASAIVGTSGSSAKPLKKRSHGDTMVGTSTTAYSSTADLPDESDDATEAAAAAEAAALEKKRRKQERKAAKNAEV